MEIQDKKNEFFINTKVICILFFLTTFFPRFNDYAQTLRSKECNNYFLNGNYSEAKKCYENDIEIIALKYGKKSPFYAKTLNYLGITQKELGEFTDAEKSFIESEMIFKSNLDIDESEFIDVQYNLAVIWGKIGKINEAVNKLIEIQEVVITNQSFINKIKQSLSNIYRENGNNSKADSIQSTIKNEIFINNTEGKIKELTNRAAQYHNNGDLKNSEKSLEKALELIINSLGFESQTYNITIGNLATIYNELNEDKKAEILYEGALNRLKINGEMHPSYTNILENYINQCIKIGNWEKADNLYEKLNQLLIEQVKHYFPSLSLEEQKLFWIKINRNFDSYYNFAFKRMMFDKTINLLQNKPCLKQ